MNNLVGETMDVRNPRTGELDFQINVTSQTQIDTNVTALRGNQVDWHNVGPAGRAAALLHLSDALQKEFASLAEALAIDTGRQTFAHFEVAKSIDLVHQWSKSVCSLFDSLANAGHSAQVPSVSFQHELVPYPVVAVISPWNVPLLLALLDAVAALAAGCAVILKPSELTPRFIQPLQRALDQVPEIAAVLNIVTGGPETGHAMIEAVDAVCFTGSVPTGQKVASHAAQCFIPAFLELGGKDPAIIMPDADLVLATRAIIRSAIGMTGQTCQSLERIYCHADIVDKFIAELLLQLDPLTLTCSATGSGDIAPLIFMKQADTIQQQVDDAISKGAKCLRGGHAVHRGGIWYPPTVLISVDHTMTIMREETFGPILPVMAFSSVEEAITLANDSQYGLSAAVFSQNIKTAETLARQLNVGAVSINDASLTGVVNDVEKNSFRTSGMGGSRMGSAGMTRFLRKRAILTQQAEPVSIALFADTQNPI